MFLMKRIPKGINLLAEVNKISISLTKKASKPILDKNSNYDNVNKEGFLSKNKNQDGQKGILNLKVILRKARESKK